MLPGLLPGLLRGKRGLFSLPRWVRSLRSSAGSLEPGVPQPVPLSKLKDSFNDATSVSYLEELERKYKEDPGSIDTTWGSFFKNLGEQQTLASQLS